MIKDHSSISGQYRHEHLTWLRILDFIRQENAMLKTRLSQALDYKTDQDFLNIAEHFQNRFVLKDDCIDELKRDIKLLERSFERTAPENNIPVDADLKAMHTKLRNEMEAFELNFIQLKNQFNRHLASLA